MRYLPLLFIVLLACKRPTNKHEVYSYKGTTTAHYESYVYDSLSGSTLTSQWDTTYSDVVMVRRSSKASYIRFSITAQNHICAVPQQIFDFDNTLSDYLYTFDSVSSIHFYYPPGQSDSLHFQYEKVIDEPANKLNISLHFEGK